MYFFIKHYYYAINDRCSVTVLILVHTHQSISASRYHSTIDLIDPISQILVPKQLFDIKTVEYSTYQLAFEK
jgi:hypothetical protein